MTKLEALKELAAKVEAGDDAGFRRANRKVFYTPCQDVDLQLREENCRYAYKGSLDAAKALHEAVLPYGWGFETFSLAGEVVLKRNKPIDRHYGFADMSPARAWLLAILRALIAQETPHD